MNDCYKVDSRKITLREYWNIYPSWKVIIPWLGGRLGMSMDLGSAFRQPDRVQDLELAEEEFPLAARQSLQPLLDECLQLGFHSPRFYRFENLRGDTETAFISLLHSSGDCVIRLMHALGKQVSPPLETRQAVLLSELVDGTFFFTTDQKPRFHSPPRLIANRILGATPAQLLASHRQKLREMPVARMSRKISTLEALDDLSNRYESYCLTEGIKRGLYVRMVPEEAAQEQQIREEGQGMPSGEHADIFREIGKLKHKKSSWRSAFWILLVTVILFALAGASQWSWSYVLILVPVLFFHELGHYLAMRLFKYQNVRMFFIPFFGAAVSGRHYNVAAWKKVVVSLMGPVPGVILGGVIGIAGLMLGNSLLVKIALVSLILNGFNLLPLLPLDGGWIVHALLFSRHYVLEAVFRVIAALGLMATGMLLDSKLLIFLGVPMLLSVGVAFRMARIASEIRQKGLPLTAVDDENIPPETANAIILELKKSLPKAHTSKMVAEQTLQVFEMLNARPPGWGATIGLLFVHGGSIAGAAILALVLMFGRQSFMSGALAGKMANPTQPLSCGSALVWGARGGPGPLVVGSFPDREKALGCFEKLTNRVPPTAGVKLFGNSVFLLPAQAEQEQWLAEMERLTETAFLTRSNQRPIVALSCEFASPALAKEVQEEINEYLTSPFHSELIPPWHRLDERPPLLRASHRLARASCSKATEVVTASYLDPRMISAGEKLVAARKLSDEAEKAARLKEHSELHTRVMLEKLAELKGPAEESVDAETINLYGVYWAAMATNGLEIAREAEKALQYRMGAVPPLGGSPDRRFSALSGLSTTSGNRLLLQWAVFEDVSEGAPALLDWWCGKGGLNLKYEIMAGPDLNDADELTEL